MENAITFTAKQEDGITGKCYNQKMLKSNKLRKWMYVLNVGLTYA
jgi:hypothetical protein